jgi:hypothetical protein
MARRKTGPQLAEAFLAARWGLRGSGQAQYLWSFLPQFQQAGVGWDVAVVLEEVDRFGAGVWVGVVAHGVSGGVGKEGTG